MEPIMTTDLAMLTYTALLTVLLAFPGVTAIILEKGLPVAAGNRDETIDLSAWADRANRAHRNLLESLPVFAALVLVANVAGVANETTALGATIFFWSRVVHAVVYIAGVPWARTAAFAGSVIGLFMILFEIL
jgi:uncharacterized MAPEG superfamily protein